MAEVSDTVIVKGGDNHIHRTIFTAATAPIAEVFTPTGPCEVLEIRIHFSAAGGAGNFTVTLDSANGAVYDTVLQTVNVTAVTDIWTTDVAVFLGHDITGAIIDALNFDWVNVEQSERTVGIEVVWRAL